MWLCYLQTGSKSRGATEAKRSGIRCSSLADQRTLCSQVLRHCSEVQVQYLREAGW